MAKANPIKSTTEVQKNPDPHIDQDFEGYLRLPGDKKMITPATKLEKALAGTEIKDGEKETDKQKLQKNN